MPTKPDPTLDPANLPSRPNTTAVGNAGGLEDEGPPEKVQLPDMSQVRHTITHDCGGRGRVRNVGRHLAAALHRGMMRFDVPRSVDAIRCFVIRLGARVPLLLYPHVPRGRLAPRGKAAGAYPFRIEVPCVEELTRTRAGHAAQCDQAILTLDRQVQRLHQRHHLCMTWVAPPPTPTLHRAG